MGEKDEDEDEDEKGRDIVIGPSTENAAL